MTFEKMKNTVVTGIRKNSAEGISITVREKVMLDYSTVARIPGAQQIFTAECTGSIVYEFI
jgi:hypothetical protein